MSNTARKIRRRRDNLKKLWDFNAAKAQLLGSDVIDQALLSPREYMGQVLVACNVKNSKRNSERMRDALLRARGLKRDSVEYWTGAGKWSPNIL